jgi:hypothetical protein
MSKRFMEEDLDQSQSPLKKGKISFYDSDDESNIKGNLFGGNSDDSDDESNIKGNLFGGNSDDSDDESNIKGNLFGGNSDDSDDESNIKGNLFGSNSDDSDDESNIKGNLFGSNSDDSDDESDIKGNLFGGNIESDYESNESDIKEISDINLLNYDLSNSNVRIKSFIALHNYLVDVKKKNLICSMDMEWFVRKESFGEGETTDVESFKVYTKNELLTAIGTKLLEDNYKNRNEILYYNKFTEIVLENKNPHFPLVSVSQECELCKACDGMKLKGLRKCLLVFSELADGSASKYFPIGMSGNKRDEILSMMLQVIMACLTLKKENIVHGDFNFGNILYHSEEEEVINKGKYLHYLYNGYHIYVRHLGKLWVLWDFGSMTKEGDLDKLNDRINTNTFMIDIVELFDKVNKRLRHTSPDIFRFLENMTSYIFNDKNNLRNPKENDIIEFIKNMSSYLNFFIIISDKERYDIDTLDTLYII